MPKKLVLDRALSIQIDNTSEVVTVPDGEVWKLSIAGDVRINGVSIAGSYEHTIPEGLFTGGCSIKINGGASNYSKIMFLSGLAFKLQEV